MTDHKPTSEMVSAGVASVTQNMDGIMRGEINMAQLDERCWRAMEDSREASEDHRGHHEKFRGRFALNELILIADYVDPAAVNPEMPVSDQVYETCEMVKRMAEDLGRIERKRDEHRLRADRLAEIKEEKIQLANRLSDEAEEQRERAEKAEEQVKYFERQERHLWKTLWDERARADLAESKVAELRRVIQEMVELGSDHIDTANETLVHYMDGSSEPVHGERGPHSTRGGFASRIEWLERGISAIADDCAGTDADDVAIRLNKLLAGKEPNVEAETTGENDEH